VIRLLEQHETFEEFREWYKNIAVTDKQAMEFAVQCIKKASDEEAVDFLMRLANLARGNRFTGRGSGK
jgi:hypothetical protein